MLLAAIKLPDNWLNTAGKLHFDVTGGFSVNMELETRNHKTLPNHADFVLAKSTPTPKLLEVSDTNFWPLSAHLVANKNTVEADLSAIVDRFIAAVSCLEILHKSGMVHATLNPQAILLDDEGNCKIWMWSFAATPAALKTGLPNWFLPGIVNYLSPEQSGKTIFTTDFHSDIYALGCIFYEFATGVKAFEGNDTLHLLYQHLTRQVELPSLYNPLIGKGFEQVLLKCLQKDPRDRYQNLAELKADLQQVKQWILEERPNKIPDNIASANKFSPENLYKFAFPEERKHILEKIDEGIQNPRATIIWMMGPDGGQKEALLKELSFKIRKHNLWYFAANVENDDVLPYHSLKKILDQIYQHLLALPQDRIQLLKYQLEEKLGLTLPVFLDFYPPLKKIFQLDIEHLLGIVDNNLGKQLRYAFAIFIQSFIHVGKPLVLVFENFDLAPQSTKTIIEGLLQELEIGDLTLIFSTEEEQDWLKVQIKDAVNISSKVEIGTLTEQDVDELLGRFGFALRPQKGDLNYLLNLCGGRFSALEKALVAIDQTGAIQLDLPSGKWFLNKQPAVELEDEYHGIADYYQQLLQQLPTGSFDLLKLAAAWGPVFDPIWMYKALETNAELSEVLEVLLKKKLIQAIPGNKNQYRFLNRKLYSLVLEQVSKNAKVLLLETWVKALNPKELVLEVLPLMLQLDAKGIAPHKHLLHSAAIKAKELAAFDLYFEANELLFSSITDETWVNDYDFALEVGANLLLASSLSGRYEGMSKLFENLKSKAENKDQRLVIFAAYAEALLARQDFKAYIEICVSILKEWGIKINPNPNLFRIIVMSIKTEGLMKGKQQADFHQLPLLTDNQQKIIISLLQSFMGAAYVINPKIIPELVYRQSFQSFKFGLSERFSICLSSYAFLLSNFSANYKRSAEMHQIAISLNNRFQSANATQVGQFLWEAFSANWHQDFNLTKQNLLRNYYNCRQLGMINIAFYNLTFYMVQNTYVEQPLPELKLELEQFIPILKLQQQNTTYDVTMIAQRYLHYELDLTDSQTEMDQFFEQTFRNAIAKKDSTIAMAILLNDNVRNITEGRQFMVEEKFAFLRQIKRQFGKGNYGVVVQAFFLILTIIENDTLFEKYKKEIAALVKSFEVAVSFNVDNNAARFQLLKAIITYKKDKDKSTQGFMQALELANQSKLPLTASVAARYLANIFKETGLVQVHNQYLKQCYQHLLEFGANRSAAALQLEFPNLHVNIELTTANAAGQSIDLISFTKASNSISGEIKLDQMLKNMLQVLIENAGAQRAFFFTERNSDIFLLASREEIEHIYNPPIQANETDYALTLLRYSFRTGDVILLANAAEDKQYSSDPYIRKNGVKSVCCLPIVKNKTVIGVIYLENNLLAGAFLKDRLSVLKLLSSQIAISFENAMLYNEMEQKVAERTQELKAEKEKSDTLLLNIIPADIAEELKINGSSEARFYEQVTVLFTDFVGFTTISEQLSPKELVAEIHRYFTAFDAIMDKHGLEKIKTIGDAYLAVCGLPIPVEDHAKRVVMAAKDICEFVKEDVGKFQVRVGINTGPVVAGIVGVKKYAYDIWGDTVNTAARMEQNSEPGKINISGTTYAVLENDFTFVHRGKIGAKNKGEVDMYFVM